MGAWIEITITGLTWEAFEVAPYMGAWIEMVVENVYCVGAPGSLPTWERGLKSSSHLPLQRIYKSLPTWERGLK